MSKQKNYRHKAADEKDKDLFSVPLVYRLILELKATFTVTPNFVSIRADKKTITITSILFCILITIFVLPSLLLDRYFSDLNLLVKTGLLIVVFALAMLFISIAKNHVKVPRKDLVARFSGKRAILINRYSLKDPWILSLPEQEKIEKVLAFEVKSGANLEKAPLHTFFIYAPFVFIAASTLFIFLAYLNPLLKILELTLAAFCILVATSLTWRNQTLNNLWRL